MNDSAVPLRIVMAIVLVAGLLAVAGNFYFRAETPDPRLETQVAQQPQHAAASDEAVTPANHAPSDLDLHPQLKDLKYDATIREIAKREDPVVDGWDTERFSELAGSQLKAVANC